MAQVRKNEDSCQVDQKPEPICLDEPDPIICPDAGQQFWGFQLHLLFFPLALSILQAFGPSLLVLETGIGCCWTTFKDLKK